MTDNLDFYDPFDNQPATKTGSEEAKAEAEFYDPFDEPAQTVKKPQA